MYYKTLMPAVIHLISFADCRCPRACNGQGATNVDEFKVALNECPHVGSKESSGISSRDPHAEDDGKTRHQVHQGFYFQFNDTPMI